MPSSRSRLELGRQTVGVPAEPALDVVPAHRLVARHDVLGVAGQEVAVVRQPVGERRAVVEDVLVAAVLPRRARVDRRLEGAVGVPVGQDVLLEGRQVRGGRNGYGRAVQRVGHRADLLWCVTLGYEDDRTRTGRAPPRYHLACRPPGRDVDHFVRAVTGLPVRFYWGLISLFLRRLTGDSRVDACAPRVAQSARSLRSDSALRGTVVTLTGVTTVPTRSRRREGRDLRSGER